MVSQQQGRFRAFGEMQRRRLEHEATDDSQWQWDVAPGPTAANAWSESMTSNIMDLGKYALGCSILRGDVTSDADTDSDGGQGIPGMPSMPGGAPSPGVSDEP